MVALISAILISAFLPSASLAAVSAVEELESAFTQTAAKASPGVVHVATSSKARGRSYHDWLREYYGYSPPQEEVEGAGSGFVIRDDGLILTNDHVLSGADRIVIRTQDRRQFEAEILGRDPDLDLAVIKALVPAGTKLTAIPLGDSDQVKVGQWVMAIGNPFNFDHTVTVGVVSALARRLGEGDQARAKSYIQTDASINPGNSGGPLLNVRGEVVGVNSAIYSNTRSSVGLGFAIPINLAKRIVSDLLNRGQISSPDLGLRVRDLDSGDLKRLGLASALGVMVTGVVENGPGALAGLRAGDAILKVDGVRVENAPAFLSRIQAKAVGQSLSLSLRRPGLDTTVSAKVEEKWKVTMASWGNPATATWEGLMVSDITLPMGQDLGVRPGQSVMVFTVREGSVWDEAGFRSGDLIRAIQNAPILGVKDFRAATAKVSLARGFRTVVERAGHIYTVVVQK